MDNIRQWHIVTKAYYKDDKRDGEYKEWDTNNLLTHTYCIGTKEYKISLRKYMSLLYFKNRLRRSYRKRS